jgi:hypothetical protein
MGKTITSKMPTRQGVKKFFIGDPRRFAYEHRMKMHKKPGSLLREGFKAPGVMSKAMLYGLPAVEAVNIARDEPGNRAERIGGLLGGTAAGLAAWGPTGLLGSMAAGALGERFGRGVGRTAKYITGQTPKVTGYTNLPLGDTQETPYTWR